MSNHQLQKLSSDPLQHLDSDPVRVALARHTKLSGCFTIIPLVEICYSTDGGGFKVCLRLAGVEIACANIDPANPCATLEGNLICAKASVSVCIEGNCLTYKAQACYKDIPCIWGDWHCTEASGNIICF